MAVRDWPEPARRALGCGLAALSPLIAFGPLSFLMLGGELWRSMNSPGQVFGSYAVAITVLTSSIAIGFLHWKVGRGSKRSLAPHVALGGMLGLFISAVMIAITPGVSPVVAPAAGLITCLFALILRFLLPGEKPEAGPN